MIPKKPDHVRWTDAQWEAIHHTGENILVSAGAGSGKTAVLTERVIELVKKGTDINRLLVVTFTKAAALEMKERIRERLIKEISEGNAHLSAQLSLLDVANISTFDSFSLFVVKKYAHAIKLSSNINIGDQITLDKLKQEILDALILEKFASKDQDFLTFARTYSKKSSFKLKAMVQDLSLNLLKNPDFEKVLEMPLDHYVTETFYETIYEKVNLEIMHLIESIQENLNALKAHFNHGDQHEYIESVIKSFEILFENPTADGAYYFLREFVFPRLPSKVFIDEDKEELESIRDKIKDSLETMEFLASEPFDAFKEKHTMHHKFQKTLKALTKEFLNRYLNAQKEEGLFDFQTMAYLSVDILRKNPDLLHDLKSNYDQIMVDEYQDTNLLQDRFIEMLGNDNLYLVGDIKQSIYRFRDATPELFQEKYERYIKDSSGKVIHLNQNFRSRKEVIDAINEIFKRSFSKDYGGIDYDEHQALQFGLTPYLKELAPFQEYGLKIHTYHESELKNYEELWPNKTNFNKTSATVEASFMIKDIQEKMANKFQVFDKDLGTLRDAKYNDFIILIDRKSYFEVYQALFQSANIPLHIHKQESFINHEDVLVMVHLFKLYLSLKSEALAKKHFKFAFLSVMYSYISPFTQDEIVGFLNDLKSLHPKEIFKTAQSSVFKNFFETYEDLIRKGDTLTLSDILLVFNERFDVLNKAVSLHNITDIEDRFLFILEQLRSFESRESFLEEVIDYFEYTIKNNDPNNFFFSVDIDYLKGTMIVEDHVNIMTIHKSKGLEFPVVYYPQLFSSSSSKLESQVFFDENLGLVMPFMIQGSEKTLLHFIKERENIRKDISERLRVFYVALTRARENMVAFHQYSPSLMPSEVYLNKDKIPLKLMNHMSSFSDLLQGVHHALPQSLLKEAVSEASFIKPKMLKPLDFNKEIIPQSSLYTYETIRLESTETKASRFSMNPLIKGDASLEKALELGNELHAWFENLTFHLDIQTQLDTMNASPLVKKVVNAFFENPLIEKLRYEKVYKELPFITLEDGIQKRGIIDLVFETKDELVIIDYKTRSIDKEAYSDQVKGYMTYLSEKTKKPVKGYLYSLMETTLKQV